ncbi:hypothetical protein MRX96_018639 [Rhipicephalus microplus]
MEMPKKNDSLMDQYEAEMRRSLAEGIAEPAVDEVASDGHTIYYIPYQPVLRQQSSKNLRIMFDASPHGVDARSRSENMESGRQIVKSVVRSCVVRERVWCV